MTFTEIIDLFLHLQDHLEQFTRDHGGWVYLFLFGIVFCETGLVVTPFLPGDSLLFAAGAVAASLGTLNIHLLCGILFAAAVLGDAVNYHIGRFLGPRVLSREKSRWLNPKHIEQTRLFFDRYGAKTIVLARFVPIVRTFAPFVAGIGGMNYRTFLFYNLLGGALWVWSMTWAGYLLGTIPWVKERFELIVIAIVAVSIAPAAWEILRHRWKSRTAAANESLAQEPQK